MFKRLAAQPEVLGGRNGVWLNGFGIVQRKVVGAKGDVLARRGVKCELRCLRPRVAWIDRIVRNRAARRYRPPMSTSEARQNYLDFDRPAGQPRQAFGRHS